MISYPIGIQSFAKLRGDGYVYVDKTRYVHQLAHSGCYYFLSRPRRFGKSLLLSTLKSYFEGRRELFHGLAIEELETEWTAYPVLYLDINSGKYTDPGSLATILNNSLASWEAIYGSDPLETTFSLRFIGVIRRAHEQTGQRVVILVDEYDKPMLQTIGNEELQADHRAELKAFYSVLKTMDEYIRFAFLTGVTKFGKVSVFSDLNNLEDISMLPEYTAICGLTEQEIRSDLQEGVTCLAAANRMSLEETYAELRRRYDGYHFNVGAEGIYNPFSVLNTLKNKMFGDYWFDTGTPTFLVELMKRADYALPDFQGEAIESDTLNCIDPLTASPIPVIYQAGYLTIVGIKPRFRRYLLDFPNDEVRCGFLKFILPTYTPHSRSTGLDYIETLVNAAEGGDPETLMQTLHDFFATGDYHTMGRRERDFQNAMYIIFRLLGLLTHVETATARGRIDLTIATPDYVYLLELKYDGTPEEALRQIHTRRYAEKFTGDPRRLYLIGANFAPEERGISGWVIE